ncbi:lipopolysaccharide heptosyltransferase family protein [Aeromonas enteropelogenes]|uniref:glycosyltransferase family 9 protein n=1 Tax=Aeromonas enteropelogenes TaxID=29489 RepID=UPI003134E129
MNLKKWVKYRFAHRLVAAQPVAAPINGPVKSLLVICFDAIGDFVLSLPALDALRRRYPDAQMELLCSPRNLVLARQVDGVVACHPVTLNDRLFDRAGWNTLRELKARRFDAVINLFDEPDELAMARMLYVANGRLLSLPLRRKSDNQQKLLPLFRQCAREVAATTQPHFVYRMLAIVEGEGALPANIPCPYSPGYDTRRFGRYVVVNLAGSQSGNSISRERQTTILAALPILEDVRYLCFSSEPLTVERSDLTALYPDSILDAASLVRDAVAVVSTDTSIVHIAASHEVPTLILMNDEPWREAFIPLHGPHRIIKVPGNSLDALKSGEVAAALSDMLVS